MTNTVGFFLLGVMGLAVGGFILAERDPVRFALVEADFLALFSPSDGAGGSQSYASSADSARSAPPGASSDSVAPQDETLEEARKEPLPPGSPPGSELVGVGRTEAESEQQADATIEAEKPKAGTPPSLPPWQPPVSIPAQPNWTWTTTDGHTYKDVKILSIDPDKVSITHDEGAGSVAMATLPAELQKQLNYDPQFAADWKIGRMVSGNLVRLENGAEQRVDDSAIRPVKYFALYYSAQWCPPCHRFTPKLVQFYNAFKPLHPDFELIFVSDDHDANSMLDYMKEMSMPWLAVNYGILAHGGWAAERPKDGGAAERAGIEGFCGNGIPDLVLVDATGKVLSDSYREGRYVGPGAVVEDIMAMVQ